ncbi:hypothetical protein N0V90_004796 [Kalmusia sp. IMI 367209]|nr:hypothetical protein N0V90_004796 [Kalmusia sp. IMI 367209]
MTSTIGIPIKLLNEAAGHIVTLEITSGEVYRGKLIEAEDNMNVQLKDITVTARDGRVAHLEQVYIRGSHVRYFIVPDMLRNAPMFRSRGTRGRGQRALRNAVEGSMRVLEKFGKEFGLARHDKAKTSETPQATFSHHNPTMEIHNPRRILALGAPESGVLSLLKDLTGSAPDLVSDTTAGLSHEWHLETKYYTAKLPIWIDEIPDVSEWRTEFTKPEAREVVSVLGAWIFCFKKPIAEKDVDTIKETLQAIADVIEKACGYGADQVCLAVAMPQSTTPYLEKSTEDWDELCMEYGFEFVDSEAKGKNEFGEEMGIKRVEDALKANEWDGGDGDKDLDFETDDFNEGLDAEEREMGMELFGMKNAVHGLDDDEEAQVEELEGLMRRMVAIKETSEGMSEADRKRFAAKAVNDLMKDL